MDLINQSINEIDTAKMPMEYFCIRRISGKDKAIVRLFNRNDNYRRVLYEWLNKRMLGPYNFAMLKSKGNM